MTIARILLGLLVFGFCTGLSLAAEQKLRFVTLEFAPFIYGKNQEVSGPGRDVIAAVCAKAGIDCTFDIYPWRRAQDLMRKGDADGMMVIGRNPDREKWLIFSPPMFRTEYGFFVSAENDLTYEQPDSIQGYRVGVFAPSNTARTLSQIQTSMQEQGIEPVEIDERPSDAAGFRKLAAGRLDAVFSNRDRGWQILKEEGLADTVRYAGAHNELFYFAGITKSYPQQDVADRFFETWEDLSHSGVLQETVRSYGLEPASKD